MSDYKRAPMVWLLADTDFLDAYHEKTHAKAVPYVPLDAVQEALKAYRQTAKEYLAGPWLMDYLRNQRWMEPPKPEPRQAMYGDKIRWRGPHGPTKLKIYGRDGCEYWCDRNGELVDDEITRPLEYEVYNPTTDTWHPCSGFEGDDSQ